MTSTIVVSSSLQDYLEAVLNLAEKNSAVRITDLAEALQITKPSVTEAVQALVNLGLLAHQSYGPVNLTTEGKRQALEIRHRHCMLKRFFNGSIGSTRRYCRKGSLLDGTCRQPGDDLPAGSFSGEEPYRPGHRMCGLMGILSAGCRQAKIDCKNFREKLGRSNNIIDQP